MTKLALFLREERDEKRKAVPPKAETPEAKPAAAPSPTPKPSADQPRYGGVLNRSNFEDPPSLDVHQERSVNALASLANCYSGLVRYDPLEVTKVVPDLAERWEVSPKGDAYTFHMRKGVQWHDGKPVTAEDAKYSVERIVFWKEHKIVSPRGGSLLTAVKDAEIVGENTVKINLKYPSASFLGNFAIGWTPVMPKLVIEAKGNMKKDVVGTGAFRWKRYNPGVSQELEKNPNYFVKGLPYLDGVTVYTIKDDATRFAALRTGQVKMTTLGSRALTQAQAEVLRTGMADKIVVQQHAGLVAFTVFMNVQRKPWDDVRARRAVNLALDRQAAVKINYGMGALGAAMDPMGAWGINQTEMAKRPGYRQPKDADIAEAKKLLAEAGFPNGLKTTMVARAGGAAEHQAVVTKEQLSRVGIEAELDIKELGTLTDIHNRRAFDISMHCPSHVIDDPDVTMGGYYVTDGASNYSNFSDKEIDDLFQKQASTLEAIGRKKIVMQMQERPLDVVPTAVIFWDTYNMGHWKDVRDYKPGPGSYNGLVLDRVWLAK